MKMIKRYLPKTLRMLLGFALIALGIVIAKQSFCLAPWHVFNDGLSCTLHITMGTANILVGACILLLDLLLRETFGIGMVLNILLVSVFTDLFLALNTRLTLLPRVEQIPQQILFCLLALLVNAFGIYFYMSARMGAGPRDTLIVFAAKHLPLSVGTCKLLIEAAVCLTGWLLGGEVGLGTFIFVLCGGPILQGVFRLLHFDVKAVKNESVLDTWRILTHRQAG